MKSVDSIPCYYWYSFRKAANATPPVFGNRRRDNFWFELREYSKTIYFQFNAVVEKSGDETMEEFTERFGEFADTHDFDRLIIDLRRSGGGGGGHAFPLVNMIKDHPKINRKGKLFVLTARTSLSAAVIFAAMLQNNTKAIFVGEPTGQGPVFYSGPSLATLPNSKLAFLISTRLNLASFPDDRRRTIEPDVPVRYSYRDFKEGRDPVL